MKPIKAYIVHVYFGVTGVAEADVTYPFDPDLEDQYNDESCQILKAITPEIRAYLGEWFRRLRQLGCICGGRDDETPKYYLVIGGACELPRVKVPFFKGEAGDLCLGLDLGRDLESVPGAKIQACVWAEEVECERAFAELAKVAPDHELSPWGGERTPARLPQPDEAMNDWLRRIAISESYARDLTTRLERFHFSLGMALAMPPPTASAAPTYVLDGVWPLGDTGMLVAPAKTGKTSLLHYLLHVASAPVIDGTRKMVLGRDVPGEFTAAFLSGEEGDWYFVRRQERFNALYPGGMIIREKVTKATFRQALDGIRAYAKREGIVRGILGYDSVTILGEGDDTKSHVAADFHQTLLDFAQETGWAVVGTHHTTKIPPRTFSEYRKTVKGSTVHIDIPRYTVGMLKRGGSLYEIGCVASNLPPDLAWLPEGESILCEGDPESYTFEPVTQDCSPGRRPAGDDIERVFAAIQALIEAGRKVQKSGAHGLYEQRVPSLHGLSRNFIQQAIRSLIDCGRLDIGADGLCLAEP